MCECKFVELIMIFFQYISNILDAKLLYWFFNSIFKNSGEKYGSYKKICRWKFVVLISANNFRLYTEKNEL